jgi:hypothetical protein
MKVLLFLLFFSSTLSAETIKVLGIGNSFTSNAFKFLPQIAKADSQINFKLGRAFISGGSLRDHVEGVKNSEDGSDYVYRSDKNQQYTLIQFLEKEDWDYITIQQVSSLSINIETFEPYAEQLIELIKKYSPKSEILIHQTWAYRADANFRIISRQKGYNQLDMYADLERNYQTLAENYNLRIIPVGKAFQIARELQPFVVVDKNQSADKKIQNQNYSLIRGFYKIKNEVRFDGRHASNRGSMLASLVWYSTLTKKDPKPLNLRDDRVKHTELEFLKEIVARLVTQ